MKRIATIQDISCLGKCSLTVALPVISAMGVEACIVPTAVLSTHTMFKNFTFHDLTDELRKIANHWENEKFEFDALYTGYLGSFEQIKIVEEYFEKFGKRNTLKIVDPVMGDNGKLYVGFNEEFAQKMKKMCNKADIIVPNLTEAAFMLNEPYIGDKEYNEEDIKAILKKLCKDGPKIAILTGVSFEKGKIGVMGFDNEKNEYFTYFNNKVDAAYHGTGDLFASTMTGALMNGLSLINSLKLAADYTAECIKLTANTKNSIKYGVYFETLIPNLIKEMNELKK